MLIKYYLPDGSSSIQVNTLTSSSVPPRKGSDHSYKEDRLQMNQVRILQMKLQSYTLVVMKVMYKNTPCKEKHMTQPDYKDLSTEISAEGRPTV